MKAVFVENAAGEQRKVYRLCLREVKAGVGVSRTRSGMAGGILGEKLVGCACKEMSSAEVEMCSARTNAEGSE